MRANDTIRTGPAVSGLMLRAALVVVVGVGALVLNPLIGWLVAALLLAVTAAIAPQTFAAYGSAACFVLGMLFTGPDPGRTLLAVLVVHVIHVLSSLLLVTPVRTRVLLGALLPTARRLVSVQALAQPVAVLSMIVVDQGTGHHPWAAVVGAVALGVLSVLLVTGRNRALSDGASAGAGTVRDPEDGHR